MQARSNPKILKLVDKTSKYVKINTIMINALEQDLKKCLKGKILILGIGNPLRSDDGFGSILAKRLKDKIEAVVIDAQSTPENYLNKLVEENPDTVLILDAADFQAEPAQVRLFDPHQAQGMNHFSTHNLPLNLLVEFIEHSCQADIVFLALQPKSVSLGEKTTEEVARKIESLENIFLRILPKTPVKI